MKNIIIIGLVALILIFAIAFSIEDSEQTSLDNVCNEDNYILERVSGSWVCGVDNVGFTDTEFTDDIIVSDTDDVNITIISTNHETANLQLIRTGNVYTDYRVSAASGDLYIQRSGDDGATWDNLIKIDQTQIETYADLDIESGNDLCMNDDCISQWADVQNKLDIYYAEGFFNSNNTNPYTITISTTGVFYNLTEWTPSDYNGFTWSRDGVVVSKDALYKLNGVITYTGGNGGKYGFVLLKNGIPQPDCSAGSQSTNIISSLNINCLISLNVDDYLNIAIRDINTPTQDVEVYKTNFNIVEII